MVQVRKLGAPFSKIRYRGRVMGVDSDGTQSVQGVRSHGGPWERGLNTLHFTSWQLFKFSKIPLARDLASG
jgi:hypothetical protein